MFNPITYSSYIDIIEKCDIYACPCIILCLTNSGLNYIVNYPFDQELKYLHVNILTVMYGNKTSPMQVDSHTRRTEKFFFFFFCTTPQCLRAGLIDWQPRSQCNY